MYIDSSDNVYWGKKYREGKMAKRNFHTNGCMCTRRHMYLLIANTHVNMPLSMIAYTFIPPTETPFHHPALFSHEQNQQTVSTPTIGRLNFK